MQVRSFGSRFPSHAQAWIRNPTTKNSILQLLIFVPILLFAGLVKHESYWIGRLDHGQWTTFPMPDVAFGILSQTEKAEPLLVARTGEVYVLSANRWIAKALTGLPGEAVAFGHDDQGIWANVNNSALFRLTDAGWSSLFELPAGREPVLGLAVKGKSIGVLDSEGKISKFSSGHEQDIEVSEELKKFRARAKQESYLFGELHLISDNNLLLFLGNEWWVLHDGGWRHLQVPGDSGFGGIIDGKVWFYSPNAVFRLEFESGQFIRIAPPEESSDYLFAEASDDKLFVVANDKLYRWENDAWKAESDVPQSAKVFWAFDSFYVLNGEIWAEGRSFLLPIQSKALFALVSVLMLGLSSIPIFFLERNRKSKKSAGSLSSQGQTVPQ